MPNGRGKARVGRGVARVGSDVEIIDAPAAPAFHVQLARSGHRVEVPRGFDREELRRLLASLS